METFRDPVRDTLPGASFEWNFEVPQIFETFSMEKMRRPDALKIETCEWPSATEDLWLMV